MEIPSHELLAFRMVATELNFSAAANRVHITQSALSQRIQSLEQRLGLTLFIRDRKEIRLTEAGIRLLRYCQAKDHLEAELLNDLIEVPDGKLGGHLRVAGYSTVLHSVIIPALAPLLRENPAIHFEFGIYEIDELPEVLISGRADFVIMDKSLQKSNLNTIELGQEQYILIQSSKYSPSNVYLDHDLNDKTTSLFFKMQEQETQIINRSYVNDIDGILNGVMLGLGQGVVPRHLLDNNMPVQMVQGIKPMLIPVVLHYFHQPYYSNLQSTVIETLKDNCQQYLAR